MPKYHRKSELVLVIGFLAVIVAVPITQTCLELARGERVQFTDVFRYRPTAKNLRQFEHTLEEKSWFQQKLRPEMQRLLFKTLRDTGAKAVLGRDDWLFYRPDLRYLVESPAPEPPFAFGRDAFHPRPKPPAEKLGTRWNASLPDSGGESPVARAILRFRDQLQQRGIALVVVPVPGKASIYPGMLTRRAADKAVRSPTLDLIGRLRGHGIETVDLFSAFNEARQNGASNASDLYLAQDTHWTPRGAQLAAQVVANQLRELKLAPEMATELQTQIVSVTRWGDILDMMQILGLREVFPPEKVECQQVLDAAGGLLVPSPADRSGTFRFPGQGTSVLILGDSFCRIYQFPEPQSLGEAVVPVAGQKDGSGTKHLLPGSAGFISHLALALKSPVDAIVSDGGASTDVRRKLSTNPEILEGKKVVIWEFVERDIALGAQGWEDVPLPMKLD